MHNLCLDDPLHKWFDCKTPKTTVPSDYIEKALYEDDPLSFKANAKIVWLGNSPSCEYFTQSKKGMRRQMATLQMSPGLLTS